jgi:outer membrane protein W
MRKLRTLVIAALALATVPSIARAQEGRLFTDAWFWGVKGGAMTFWTTRVAHQTAPVLGAEWLLTRKKAGLYISFDQSNFSAKSTYRNFEYDSASRGTRYAGEAEASIKNNRRLTAAAMTFPTQFGNFRPYAGLGFAVNFLGRTKQTAGPLTTLGNRPLNDVSSSAAPILILGTQYALNRVSVFGQGSYMPVAGHFLFNNNPTYFIEGGVRYNIGSSIERGR